MKQNRFYYNFTWSGYILLILGLFFSIVAVVAQLIPIPEDNFNLTVNGVSQPYSPDNAIKFRLIFLLVFGIISVILLIVGFVLIYRSNARKKKNLSLKQTGQLITGKMTECMYTHITINNHRALKATCFFESKNGERYTFITPFLKRNPMPYLIDDAVKIYWDPNNKKNYFVDIEDSIGKINEL